MTSRSHPLAAALIERLQSRPASKVLDFASGSGRNGAALQEAGFRVTAIADELAMSTSPFANVQGPFAAVISTHGFLHGDWKAVTARIGAVAGALERGGLLYATFGSTRDARFGHGRRIDDSTFAPLDGDERDVAHVYFDPAALRALLAPHFDIESLEERGVDDVAGGWAHRQRPLRAAVHWFAVACRR